MLAAGGSEAYVVTTVALYVLVGVYVSVEHRVRPISQSLFDFQISKSLSLLGDAQVIFNPANNPNESSVWLFGVRAILTL